MAFQCLLNSLGAILINVILETGYFYAVIDYGEYYIKYSVNEITIIPKELPTLENSSSYLMFLSQWMN